MAANDELKKYIGLPESEIPESVIDAATTEVYFGDYFVDQSGKLQSFSERAATRASSVNNPQPEDTSLYEPPPVEPISVPGAEEVTNVSEYDWTDVATDDGLNDYADNYADVEAAGQTSYPYKKVTDDAPEDNDYDDEYEDDFEVTSNQQLTEDISDTGAPAGLNSDPKATTKVNNPQDATAINDKKVFSADLGKIEINPRPNELNAFASFTYNISLYMLNSNSYVNLVTAPSTPRDVLNDSLLLMRSGGVGREGRDTAAEAAFAGDNFYIDDLELNSIAVGPSKFKQNTNVTEIRFTIIEPRGVTLLEKLRDAAKFTLTTTKEKYIHAPYLLEIMFKGYDDRGTPMRAPSKPKYIPIKITDIQFEVSADGTMYKVQAVPFAHSLFGQINSTIPMNIELTAGTIGNIFSDGARTLTTEVVEERVYDTDFDTEGRIVKKEKIKYGDSFKNLGEVLTDYQRKRTEPTIKKGVSEGPPPPSGKHTPDVEIPAQAEKYDTFEFLLASEIANARLNVDDLFDALDTPAPTGQKKDDGKANKSQFQAYAEGMRGSVSIDKDKKSFKINAGTDVTKLLNLVIMHSDYMDRNVLENAEKGITDGQPIKWFKIKPIIQSATGPGKGFDGKDGRYKYHIIYVVEPSAIYYHDFPWAKKSKPKGNGFHKKYDYIYSGQNTEVLDFKMQFRSAFLQVMTAGTGSPFADKTGDDDFSPLVKEQPQSPEGNTTNGADSTKRARAKDLFSSVMSDGVDMVELKMNIKGDPAYLATSDAYWQDKVRQGNQYTEAFMPDGTINYDLSVPYVQVNLKTPTDYDPVTGLADPNKATNSKFSGIYRLTNISSTFAGGMFEQTINGVRATVQPTKDGVARDDNDTSGKERKAVKKDEQLQKKQSNTPVQSGGAYGEFGIGASPVPEAKAQVVSFAEQYDEPIPYTSPTVNNTRTAEIARQADATVVTIPDVDADMSSTWTPPSYLLKREPTAPVGGFGFGAAQQPEE